MSLSLAEMRPNVRYFAQAMEAKLKANDHKRGWGQMSNGSIMARVRQELAELSAALATKDPKAIREEAADVANFLMMLCDNNQALLVMREASRKSSSGQGETENASRVKP